MKLKILAFVGFAAMSVYIPLQAGDAGAGASAYNARGCVSCHGVSGKEPVANHPVIGGMPQEYIIGELNKFRTGERDNLIMMHAANLSDADVRNLAAYLESQ